MPVVLRQKRLSAKKQTAFLFSITSTLFLGPFCVQYFAKVGNFSKIDIPFVSQSVQISFL